jgi:hypothetical protein
MCIRMYTCAVLLVQVKEESHFQRELRQSLEANRCQWESQVQQAITDGEAAERAQREWVPELESKVKHYCNTTLLHYTRSEAITE